MLLDGFATLISLLILALLKNVSYTKNVYCSLYQKFFGF